MITHAYADNPQSRVLLDQEQWAFGILEKPAVTWPNGRNSHAVAGEVLEQTGEALIEHLCLVATPD